MCSNKKKSPTTGVHKMTKTNIGWVKNHSRARIVLGIFLQACKNTEGKPDTFCYIFSISFCLKAPGFYVRM
jgi:hypothetical protein